VVMVLMVSPVLSIRRTSTPLVTPSNANLQP
jgi:hypothetical protein